MSNKPRLKAHPRSSKPHAPASPAPGRAPRPAAASGPEIQARYAPVGRETLAAIAEELAVGQEAYDGDPRAAIEGELPEAPAVRERRRTLGFEEEARSRVTSTAGRLRGAASNRPATEAPTEERTVTARATRGADRVAPGAQKSRGRPSLDAIEQHLERWARTGEAGHAPGRAAEKIDVFEMVTFVVRGELTRLSSMTARREFVAERLLGRLPVQSIDEVDRIDVTPWTVKGTVIVRVWCRV